MNKIKIFPSVYEHGAFMMEATSKNAVNIYYSVKFWYFGTNNIECAISKTVEII